MYKLNSHVHRLFFLVGTSSNKYSRNLAHRKRLFFKRLLVSQDVISTAVAGRRFEGLKKSTINSRGYETHGHV